MPPGGAYKHMFTRAEARDSYINAKTGRTGVQQLFSPRKDTPLQGEFEFPSGRTQNPRSSWVLGPISNSVDSTDGWFRRPLWAPARRRSPHVGGAGSGVRKHMFLSGFEKRRPASSRPPLFTWLEESVGFYLPLAKKRLNFFKRSSSSSSSLSRLSRLSRHARPQRER